MAQPLTSDGDASQGPSLMDAVAALLRYRRMILGTALVLAFAMAVVVLIRPRTYTAGVSFTPQVTRSALSGLGGLAAQLGISVPTADNNQSPAFYSDLLRSRTVLEPVARMPVTFTWKGKAYTGSFIDLTDVKGPDSLTRLEAGVKALREAMSVSVAGRTGIVRVETTTRYPQLSTTLTDSAVGLLNSFNVATRRSQATAQRQFLEQRLAAVSQELEDAEDALRDFTKRNRGDLRSSPELMLQQERLNRAVTLRVQVYGGLAQALEQAKLDEIRETPLITIIEPARLPVGPDPRGLLITTAVALVAGTVLGAMLALFRHALAVNRLAQPERFAELEADAAAAKADLQRLVAPFRRWRARTPSERP